VDAFGLLQFNERKRFSARAYATISYNHDSGRAIARRVAAAAGRPQAERFRSAQCDGVALS
jgi:hypothetical protein